MIAQNIIGSSIITLAHRAEEAAKSIIEAVIRIFRNVLDWVYAFLYNLWDRIMTDPWGAFHLFSSMWVLMA